MNVVVQRVAVDSCDPAQPIDSELRFESGHGYARQLLQIQPHSPLRRDDKARHGAPPIQHTPVAAAVELGPRSLDRSSHVCGETFSSISAAYALRAEQLGAA